MDIAELKRRCDAVLPRATALATVVQFDPEEPEHRRGMARELLAELPAQAAAVLELITEIERLRAELAASQAREKVLRAKVDYVWQYIDITKVGGEIWTPLHEARSLPTDDTSLRAALVKAQEGMRERCAEFCESSDIEYEIGRTCAVGIRALEVTL